MLRKVFLQEIGRKKWAVALLFCTVLIYLRSVTGEFVLDDRTFFLDNDILPNLKPWNLTNIFFSPSNYWIEHLPVRDFLYVCEYYLFGAASAGYHVVSLVLYCLIGCLVFDLLSLLYSALPDGDSQTVRISALFSAAVFLLHPVHVEAVAYISSQKDLLFALFSLLAVDLFYRNCRPDGLLSGRMFLLVVLCYYLSLLSKNTAVVTAVFIPFLWLVHLSKEGGNRMKAAVLWCAVNLPAALWIFYSIRINDAFRNLGLQEGSTFFERAGRGLKILGAHIMLAIKPFPLSFGYPFEESAHPDINMLVGVAFIAALLFYISFRQRSLVTAGLLLIFLYLFPVLQIVAPLFNLMVYDRYLFIPILGVGIIAERTLSALPLPVIWKRQALYTAMAAILCLLSVATCRHVPKFHDELAMARHTHEAFPQWPEGSFYYVYALIEAGRLDQALAAASGDRLLESPDWLRGYFLGWISLERGDYGRAIDLLKPALAGSINGGYFPFPSVKLGEAFMKKGDYRQAEEALGAAYNSAIRQPVEYYRAKKLLEEIRRLRGVRVARGDDK